MLRYGAVIGDIVQKTRDEMIEWKLVKHDFYSQFLLNPHRVIRAYKAPYNLAKKEYELLFVERRAPSYDDFDDSGESYEYELFVLDRHDGEVVLSLYNGVVDRDQLLVLSGLIESHNDRVQSFFEAFNQSEEA